MQAVVLQLSSTFLLLCVQQTVAIAQPQPSAINLDGIHHHTLLHSKDFSADPRFELPDFTTFDNLRENGRIYLRCKLSGMVVCAAPVKDSYQILVFPKKNANEFYLRVTTSLKLLRDGVDAKSIESLLRIARPAVGMAGNDSAKVRLQIRIEANDESVTQEIVN